MSVYMWNLPQAFPNLVQADAEHVRGCVRRLIDHDRPEVGDDGSSFAVTVENPKRWRLWLSDTSYRYLEGIGMLEGIELWDVCEGVSDEA